jgi:two-component system, OmpR family, response regulator
VRILVVEDSAAVRARVVSLLQEYGLEVVGEAGTAADALRLADSLRPEAIVLDLHLPDGDGMDLLPLFKARQPAPLVAVLTNSTHIECRKRCLALGADHFFDKSREFEAVADTLFRYAA